MVLIPLLAGGLKPSITRRPRRRSPRLPQGGTASAEAGRVEASSASSAHASHARRTGSPPTAGSVATRRRLRKVATRRVFSCWVARRDRRAQRSASSWARRSAACHRRLRLAALGVRSRGLLGQGLDAGDDLVDVVLEAAAVGVIAPLGLFAVGLGPDGEDRPAGHPSLVRMVAADLERERRAAATEWVAKLSRASIDTDQLQAFFAWRRDPANRRAWAAMEAGRKRVDRFVVGPRRSASRSSTSGLGDGRHRHDTAAAHVRRGRAAYGQATQSRCKKTAIGQRAGRDRQIVDSPRLMM